MADYGYFKDKEGKDIYIDDTHILHNGKRLVDVIYPVGSVYISANNTSPATLFGGTWKQIKDTFLLSAGDIYKAGSTGGEANHTLTTNEMALHNHDFNATTNNQNLTGEMVNLAVQSSGTGLGAQGIISTKSTTGSIGYAVNSKNGGNGYTDDLVINASHSHTVSGTTNSTGGGHAHNNMPPYLAVYVWHRVA